MFTKHEAVEFLQNSWKVNNVERRLQTDRTKFLDEVITLIHDKVPFHMFTIHEFSIIPPKHRVVPNLQEIDRICMAGIGGNCTYINVFTRSLLHGLGYSTFFCRTTTMTTTINPHVVIIVKDLEKKGDLHMVDCGSGCPTFRAVPLNFDQESPVYQDSFLEYKFVRHGGEILRMHGQGDVVKRNDPPVEGIDFFIGKWRRFLKFTIETIDIQCLDDLGPLFNFMYLPSNLLPRAVRFPGGKAVLIFANQLMVEKDDGTLETTIMGSDKEILQTYRTYFPTINENLVLQSYSSWRRRTKLSKL